MTYSLQLCIRIAEMQNIISTILIILGKCNYMIQIYRKPRQIGHTVHPALMAEEATMKGKLCRD